VTQIRLNAVQNPRKERMKIDCAHRKTKRICKLQIPVGCGDIQLQRPMGKHDELVLVVDSEHRLEQFFAVITHARLMAVQNSPIKSDFQSKLQRGEFQEGLSLAEKMGS
jgi:hypothetical protein